MSAPLSSLNKTLAIRILQLSFAVICLGLFLVTAHSQHADVKSSLTQLFNTISDVGRRYSGHAHQSLGIWRNHSAQLADLSMVVADVHEKVASLSIQLNTIHSLNSAIHSAAPSDKQAAAESAARDRGKLFKSCVARSLANKVETWSQTSSDPKDQMKVAVQRRLQLSDVATRCGGHRMFAAAAASTIDDYTKWAAEEMKKDDGNTSKVLIIKSSDDAGLGNRLQAMVSAFLFAIVSNRLLLIEWAENANQINLPSDEKSVMPPIDSIFAPPYPWLVKDARAGNVMRALSSGKKTNVMFNGHTHRGGDNKGGVYEDLLCRNVTQWFESHDVVTIEGYDWFGPLLASNPSHFVSIYSSFGHNTFPGIFNGFLHPSADVQKILDEYQLTLFNNFYVIGVQLRVILRLSPQAEAHVWKLMLFLKSQAEASQGKPVAFYVCADTQAPWDRLVAMFGKDIIFSASIAAGRVGRVTKQDIQYGVADMLLLGECDDIILSPESTYGGVAAGRLGKSSWRITKNPEKWDDAEYESKRLVAKTSGNSPCSFGWQFAPQARCYGTLGVIPEQHNQEHDLCRTV